LLKPLTGQTVIEGASDIKAVDFLCEKYIALHGVTDGFVRLDISKLIEPLKLKSTYATFDKPIRLNVKASKRSRISPFILDVSRSERPSAFVVFDIPYKADLSNSITILHGVLNIHIDGVKSNKLKVPVVSLDGDGEFYVNGKKQTGASQYRKYRRRAKADSSTTLVWVSLSALLVCALILIWIYRPKRRIAALTRESFLARFRTERDDEVELTRYLTHDDEDVEVQ
jgi:hypothetical protein